MGPRDGLQNQPKNLSVDERLSLISTVAAAGVKNAELREKGDMIFTNDPYMCNAAVSHLPDWLVLKHVFKDGRHIAWTAMFGHMLDNGGMVPGSIPIEATNIYQEGIRIPPTKSYKKGE